MKCLGPRLEMLTDLAVSKFKGRLLQNEFSSFSSSISLRCFLFYKKRRDGLHSQDRKQHVQPNNNNNNNNDNANFFIADGIRREESGTRHITHCMLVLTWRMDEKRKVLESEGLLSI